VCIEPHGAARLARLAVQEAPAHAAGDAARDVDLLDERVRVQPRAVGEGVGQVRDVDAHLRAVRAAEVAARGPFARVRVAPKRAHRNAELRRPLDEELGPARAHRERHGLDLHARFDVLEEWREGVGGHPGQPEIARPTVQDLLRNPKTHASRQDARSADAFARHDGDERRIAHADRRA
jgi:hypothetical protein